MIKVFRRALLLTTVVVFISLLLLPLASNDTYAQTTSNSSSTTIIPPSFSLFANPGQTLKEVIAVRNQSESTQVYNISTVNFTANGVYGQVSLTSGSQSNSYSLAQWITPDQTSVTIGPHQEKKIGYAINVPNGAEPGGKYGAVVIQTAAGNNPGTANVSNAQVSLILLRVSGNVVEKATVSHFSAPQYSEYGPVPINLELKDTGDVHIKPQGQIIITDIFGSKVDEIQLNGADVLPGAQRVMTSMWTAKNPIGKFTATLIATYGSKSEAISTSTSFIVFPKPLAIGIGIAIVAIILLIILIIAGRGRVMKALKVIAQG